MRLKVEQVLAMFRPVKEDFAHNDSGAERAITTDTIKLPTSQKVEAFVDVESSTPISEREVSTGQTSSVVRRTKVDTARNAVDRSVENPVLPVSDIVLPADTISYPVEVEEFSIDSLAVTSVIAPTKAFSLEGHKKGIDHPIKLDRSDGIFALLVICFLLLAHVYNGGMAFFKENIMLVFSASKSEKLETQVTTKETVYSFFLVFLAVLLISISLYEGLDRFFPLADGDKRPFVTIGFFVVLIVLFVVAKMLLNRVIGFIFDNEKRIEAWNRSYLVLFSMLGLLCFFPTLMLVYSNLWHSIIIGFVFVLFLIVQIILFIRVIVFFIGQKFNLLYLIAYLCTIEILPYIFLGIGLVHLYKTDIFNTIL